MAWTEEQTTPVYLNPVVSHPITIILGQNGMKLLSDDSVLYEYKDMTSLGGIAFDRFSRFYGIRLVSADKNGNLKSVLFKTQCPIQGVTYNSQTGSVKVEEVGKHSSVWEFNKGGELLSHAEFSKDDGTLKLLVNNSRNFDADAKIYKSFVHRSYKEYLYDLVDRANAENTRQIEESIKESEENPSAATSKVGPSRTIKFEGGSGKA